MKLTMNGQKGLIAGRAGRTRPCPVCESATKGCSWTDDGMHLCRVEGAAPAIWKDLLGKSDSAGFHHYRRIDDDTRITRPQPSKPSPNWNNEARRFAKALTADLREELAAALKLPAACLDSLIVGWKADESCWTFPECDATGSIIGLSRRYRDGSKKNIGQRGLTIPAGWRDRTGPVLLVEGASDVLATTAANLSAIGRPSNVGGTDLLADLLHVLPADRAIIVIAENDAKPTGQWPGKEGAEKVAEALRTKLNRSVRIVYPPAEIKDAREWVHDLTAGFAEVEDWSSIGATILNHVNEAAASKSRFKFIDAYDFLHGDYRREFIINRILVKGEYGLIAGPPKSLKTSIALDAAVSMATGNAFLSEFEVVRRTRVALVSGESGRGTVQETMWRIVRAKGLEPESVRGMLHLDFTLPKFLKLEDVADFTEAVKRLGAEVVIIDPLYLCMSGQIDHANFIEMGEALDAAAERLRAAGITVIIVHHANRQLKHGATMELQHLSYSGTDTYARQWILLNRQSAYEGKGSHPLILSAGGSAGHGGLWNVDIEEGVVDGNFAGRFWDVKVRTTDEAHSNRQDEREEAKREKARKSVLHEQAEVLRAIDAECAKHEAATRTRIKVRTGFSTPKVKEVIEALSEDGVIEPHMFQKQTGQGAKTPAEGFRRVKTGQ